MSARRASATPGYWIFTATSAAVGQHRAVDLADRGGRRGLVLEVLEQLLDGLLPLLLEHLLDLLPRHRRRLAAQRRELLLVELAVLRRQELGVDERGELADLHRRALHRPERRRPSARPPPGGSGRAPRSPPSFDRTTFAARVPAYRAPEAPSAEPTFAVRGPGRWGLPRRPSPQPARTLPWRRCGCAPLSGAVQSERPPTLNAGARRAQVARRRRLRGSCPASSTAVDGDCMSFKVGARELRRPLSPASAVRRRGRRPGRGP